MGIKQLLEQILVLEKIAEDKNVVTSITEFKKAIDSH